MWVWVWGEGEGGVRGERGYRLCKALDEDVEAGRLRLEWRGGRRGEWTVRAVVPTLRLARAAHVAVRRRAGGGRTPAGPGRRAGGGPRVIGLGVSPCPVADRVAELLGV